MIQRQALHFWEVQLFDNPTHTGGGAAEPWFFKICKWKLQVQ